MDELAYPDPDAAAARVDGNDTQTKARTALRLAMAQIARRIVAMHLLDSERVPEPR